MFDIWSALDKVDVIVGRITKILNTLFKKYNVTVIGQSTKRLVFFYKMTIIYTYGIYNNTIIQFFPIVHDVHTKVLVLTRVLTRSVSWLFLSSMRAFFCLLKR